MNRKIELSKLIDEVILLDGNGIGIKKEDFKEQIEDGWIGYYLAIPVTNSIVDQAAVVTDRHQDCNNDALSEAVESFERYRDEPFTEDELAMLSFRKIIIE